MIYENTLVVFPFFFLLFSAKYVILTLVAQMDAKLVLKTLI
jgi:hypothetical protein